MKYAARHTDSLTKGEIFPENIKNINDLTSRPDVRHLHFEIYFIVIAHLAIFNAIHHFKN